MYLTFIIKYFKLIIGGYETSAYKSNPKYLKLDYIQNKQKKKKEKEFVQQIYLIIIFYGMISSFCYLVK